MGWTSFWAPSTTKSSDLVIGQINAVTQTRQWEVIDHSMRGNVFYGLVKRTNLEDKTSSYYVAVYLVSRRNGEFAYKDMDESCNPYYYDCPKRILDKIDALAPNPTGYSKEWRDTCRNRASKKTVKITHGQVITFKDELNFRIFKESKFTIHKVGAKVRFIASNGRLCQITNWKSRDFV